MRTITITIHSKPGTGMAIEALPSNPADGNETENQVASCLGFTIQKTLEVIALKAKSGTIIRAEHLSHIWEDIDKRLEVFRDKP